MADPSMPPQARIREAEKSTRAHAWTARTHELQELQAALPAELKVPLKQSAHSLEPEEAVAVPACRRRQGARHQPILSTMTDCTMVLPGGVGMTLTGVVPVLQCFVRFSACKAPCFHLEPLK